MIDFETPIMCYMGPMGFPSYVLIFYDIMEAMSEREGSNGICLKYLFAFIITDCILLRP